MFSNEKASIFLGDRKEEVVMKPMSEKESLTKDVGEGTDELEDMPFMENKSSTKDVEKGTDELSDMKQAVVTIRRKGLYQFDGESKGSTGCFKIDSRLKKNLKFIQNYIKNF